MFYDILGIIILIHILIQNMKDRRTFIKQACMAGVCLCGFPSFLHAEILAENNASHSNEKETFMQEWISTLLLSIDNNANPENCRTIMKKCAISHYEELKMDNLLSSYIGEIEKFNQFIEKEWGWKISFRKDEGVIIADENKKMCVCPLVNQKKGIKSSILCYCSEGFAELMFSKVAGHPVKARVVSSINRGDTRCVYKISLA